MRLGVVIPAFKEHENLPALVREIQGLGLETEIVIVDDSPGLESVEAIAKLNASKVFMIHRTSKGGRGSAIIEGIKRLLQGSSELILEMDADFSHPPSQIPALIAKLQEEKLDLLIASRYLPTSLIQKWPVSRRIFSRAANILARFLLQVPVSDYTNGFRLYSRKAAIEIVASCGKFGQGFISLSEILVNVFYKGFRVGEVPTTFVNRLRGESSLSLKEITNAARGLILIYSHKRSLCRKKLDQHA